MISVLVSGSIKGEQLEPRSNSGCYRCEQQYTISVLSSTHRESSE